MRKLALFVFLAGLCTYSFSQNPSGIDVQFANNLIQLERAAQDANIALGKLRIEKWKADSRVKDQTTSNVEAIQRNLSAALPELLAKVRQTPQDLSANFKLYRNLSAVYDVLASVTESAGAFGPKDDYRDLAQPVSVMDQVRRSLADRIDSLAAAKEAELAQYHRQAQAAAAAQAAAPPKKIIIDDNAPPKSSKTKKKTTKSPH